MKIHYIRLFFVPLHSLCACGGIGRRARLRIWLLTQCRFESCQAHNIKCQIAFSAIWHFVFEILATEWQHIAIESSLGYKYRKKGNIKYKKKGSPVIEYNE